MKWLDVRSAHQSADTDPDVPAARLISGSSLAASAMPLPAAYQRDGHDPVHGLVPLRHMMPSSITWVGCFRW
jgi:hypothetical protein